MIITEEIRQTTARRLHEVMDAPAIDDGFAHTPWDELDDDDRTAIFTIVDAVHAVSLPLIVAEFVSQLQAELDKLNQARAPQVDLPPAVDEALDDPAGWRPRQRPAPREVVDLDMTGTLLADPWMEK